MAAMAATMPPGEPCSAGASFDMLDVRTYAVRHACRDACSCRSFVSVEQRVRRRSYTGRARPTRTQPSSSRPAAAARREYAHVTRTGEPEDEAAVKAEAMAIVAQAKKDIKLREEARGEMKKASTKDDIQALINKRLAQSFADRPKAPEKPKEAPPAKKEAPKEAPPDPEATKKEAAAIVAAANKDYKQRLADREKAKTATAEDLQAMINAKLNISK